MKGEVFVKRMFVAILVILSLSVVASGVVMADNGEIVHRQRVLDNR